MKEEQTVIRCFLVRTLILYLKDGIMNEGIRTCFSYAQLMWLTPFITGNILTYLCIKRKKNDRSPLVNEGLHSIVISLLSFHFSIFDH